MNKLCGQASSQPEQEALHMIIFMCTVLILQGQHKLLYTMYTISTVVSPTDKTPPTIFFRLLSKNTI